MDEGSGVGVFSEPLERYATVFQAEVNAVENCAQVNLDRKHTSLEIDIVSGIQTTIRALSSDVISSMLSWDCVVRLNELTGRSRVALYWVPVG